MSGENGGKNYQFRAKKMVRLSWFLRNVRMVGTWPAVLPDCQTVRLDNIQKVEKKAYENNELRLF